MAGQGQHSHLSSTGESYIERLIREGFFFSHSGENVAKSGIPLPQIIHRAFMESTGHRENILSPQFDLVGVGVTEGRDGIYFVTQDFLRCIEPKEQEQARTNLMAKVQGIRTAHSMPPIPFSERIHLQAQLFSWAKSLGKPSPQLPEELGETHVFFITTPSLEELGQVDASISQNIYEEGGVGVEFQRSKEYPGGAYFIALMLLPPNLYQSLSPQDKVSIVFDTLNKLRREKGSRKLELASDLSREAQKIAVAQQDNKHAAFASAYGSKAVQVVYCTEDLAKVPETILAEIRVPSLKKVGLGVHWFKSKEYPRGIFIVTLILI